MNKKLIALVLAMVLVFSVFAGCGKKDDDKNKDNNVNADTDADTNNDSSTSTIDEDQYINTFMSAWPNTLDPSTGSDMYGYGVILNIIEPLIRLAEKENGETYYFAAGAESWEASDDLLTYTFHLRDNVWNDGEPVTSEHYAYGIRRSADPATACEYANLLYLVKNGQKVNSGELPLEELGVETPDDKTLVIHLENPCPYFMDTVLQRVYFPQREDLVEKYGDQYATDVENTPMCGPFLIEDWTINNEINYVKNENYWNASEVKLERVHVAVLKDANTINNALMTGELDYAGVGDPKWQAKFTEEGNYNRVQRTDPWTGYFMMNFNEGSKVANTKITRAIAAVLDRQEVIDNAWDGTPIPAWSLVPPAVTCAGKIFNTEDTGAAKKLRDEIKDPKALFEEGVKELGGDPADYTIVLRGSDASEKGRIAVEAFQQQIESALGCTVKASNDEWNAFVDAVKSADYDIAWLAWGADFNDPSNFLETCYSPTAVYPTNWKNEKFDELIELAQKEANQDKRIEYLKEAEEILLYQEAAIVPINHLVTNIFRRTYVKGAPNNYFNTMGFMTMYTEGRDE
ncbi:MAG: peptide ABC transporter substrate-binding protein [Tissierellia bacterium]|nr:peptide ABC transporter substrate-binding protein [Tissierellia bacterium]